MKKQCNHQNCINVIINLLLLYHMHKKSNGQYCAEEAILVTEMTSDEAKQT